jgi:polysaccharide export outer membrane protein
MFKRFFFATLGILISLPAFAQSPVPNVTPLSTRIEKFAEARSGGGLEGRRVYDEEERTHAPIEREIQKSEPVAKDIPVAVPEEKFSALETLYSGRADQKLEQFGYDLFGVPSSETRETLDSIANAKTEMPMGAVQDEFVLHAGDELEITFTGQRNDHGLYKINSQGLLTIKDLPPVPAEGRSIGQVRLSIEAAARNLHNTDAYVALASVRQIAVLVVGHVNRPGRQTLTVFHTVIDALTQAGGVDKTGSLRQIKLVRGGTAQPIDLYSVLTRGGAGVDLQLRDGDRIIVPPIGPTVAIAGEVKRPGIYETMPLSDRLTLAEMLDLSGGVLVPGRNRFLNLEVTRSGHEKVSEIHETAQRVFGDGAVLMVAKGQEKRAGTVEIIGHSRRPGLYALDQAGTLADLLSSPDVLGSDPYSLIGVIERRNLEKLSKELIAFPLNNVLKNEYDLKLADADRIHIFSDSDIRRLGEPALKAEKDDPLNDPAMASFLKERAAFVRGAVRSPGSYPVAENITLESVLAAAGGPTLEADTGQIEITAAPQDQAQNGPKRRTVTANENVIVRAGDAVRVNQKFRRVEDKSVLLLGEVKNPGRYDLLQGDRVSDLLTRAGGLTEDAYPDGAIFSRENERKAEEARFRAQARQMQSAIASALEADDEKIGAGQIAEARALAQELEDARGVGRITVEADPYILQREPDLDMLLESGDRLYIPKRSLTVRVSGEVLSPASLQFRKNKEPTDYVDEAGGFTMNADKDRAFVVYPDGSAQPLEMGWGYGGDVFVPPGSTIVVPRDPEPFDFIQSAKDVSQILSNLAITALFIDDVKDDD